MRKLVGENVRWLLLLVVNRKLQMQPNVHDIRMHVPNVAQLWRMTQTRVILSSTHSSFRVVL